MRIVLKLADGSDEVRDVTGATISLGEWNLELSAEQDPYWIHLYVPVNKDAYCRFVTHHCSANSMNIEIRPSPMLPTTTDEQSKLSP